MKSWIFLVVAIVSEVIGTSSLKASNGFSRLGPSLLTVAGFGVSFFFLSLTLRVVPISVAYAIWSGIGIVLITLVGWFFFGQRLDLPALIGVAIIAAGVMVLSLFSKTLTN